MTATMDNDLTQHNNEPPSIIMCVWGGGGYSTKTLRFVISSIFFLLFAPSCIFWWFKLASVSGRTSATQRPSQTPPPPSPLLFSLETAAVDCQTIDSFTVQYTWIFTTSPSYQENIRYGLSVFNQSNVSRVKTVTAIRRNDHTYKDGSHYYMLC